MCHSTLVVLLLGHLFTLSWGFIRMYDLKLERIEFVNGAPPYLANNHIRITKLNRTLEVVNGSVELIKNFPRNAYAEVIGYEKNINTYSAASSLNVSKGCCSFMENEKMIYPQLKRHSNFPGKCPVEAGHYYIKNYVIDETLLPPELPGEKWKVEARVYTDKIKKKLMFAVKVYLSIIRSKIPKFG